MLKISFKGVVVGAIVDIVSTNILSMPLMIYIAYVLAKSGLNQVEVHASLVETMRSNTLYFGIAMCLGSLCSILGGFVAAKIAKKYELLNGGLASFLCVGSGVYSLVIGGSSQSIWFHLLSIFMSVALTTFGGYLGKASNLKKQAATQ
jgi:hypothetical protein